MIDWLIHIDEGLTMMLNGSESMLINRMMLDITTWWAWIPLYVSLIFLVLKNNETFIRILLAIGCALLCFALTEILADAILKPLVARPRPFNVAGLHVQLVDGYKADGYSFVSAHAANTFGLFLYIALLIRSRVLTVAMAIWTILSSYSRIFLGVHFVADVICGMIIGALVAGMCFKLQTSLQQKAMGRNRYVSKNLTSTGYDTADVDGVICIMLLTFVVIIIHTLIKA